MMKALSPEEEAAGELNLEQIVAFSRDFSRVDEDGDGRINFDEIVLILQAYKEDLNVQQVEDMINAIDRSGTLNFAGFLTFMQMHMDRPNNVHLSETHRREFAPIEPRKVFEYTLENDGWVETRQPPPSPRQTPKAPPPPRETPKTTPQPPPPPPMPTDLGNCVYYNCLYRDKYGCTATKQSLKLIGKKQYLVKYYKNHTCTIQRKNEKLEYICMVAALLIEAAAAACEQLSYKLLGLTLSFVGLLLCVGEILSRVKAENVRVKWVGKIKVPRPYSHYPTYRPFGSTQMWFGLLAGIWQCFHSSVGYYFTAVEHRENPIKLSAVMLIFCLCVGFSHFMKWNMK